MDERPGVGVAIVSCCCGAGAAVATRYLIGAADPITLAAIRFGGGVLCLLPLAALLRPRWPPRSDWPAVAGLGFMFYAVFFVFYNVALAYTTLAMEQRNKAEIVAMARAVNPQIIIFQVKRNPDGKLAFDRVFAPVAKVEIGGPAKSCCASHWVRE